MKKIFTLFAALAMVMSMSAKTIYLKPNSNWTKDGAWFAAYLCNGSEAASWHKMNVCPEDGTYYQVDIDDAKLDENMNKNIIFCRMNPASSNLDWGSKWNQSGNLDIKKLASNNCCAINSEQWDCGTNVTWSTFTPVVVEYTYTIAGASDVLGSHWDVADDKNDMIKQNDGTYVLTKENVRLSKETAYEYKVVREHSWDWSYPSNNASFNVNKSGTYNVTFTFDGKTDLKADPVLIKEEVVIPEVHIAGKLLNNWSSTANKLVLSKDSLTASATIALKEGTDSIKMVVGGNWMGNNGTMTRKNNGQAWTFKAEEGNCAIVADIAGNYVFTWNFEKNQLTVTYPELPTYNVTATVNPAKTGSVEGAKEYKQGEQATLTATPAAGYEFVNWTKGEDVVSTENPYKFTVTADVTLVANFKKSVQTITLSYDITSENIGNRMGRQTISVEDENYGNPQLVIEGFCVEVAEYTEASLSINDETLKATATYTNDNGQEVYTATATTEDGLTIYNVTFNVVAPAITEHTIMNIEYPTVTVEDFGGSKMYIIEGEAVMDTEDNVVNFNLTVVPSLGFAEGGIGTEIYGSGEATMSEPVDGEVNVEATLTDEAGNIYNFFITIEAPEEEEVEVEIVIANTVKLDGYQLELENQGNMATVSAKVNGIELSFWLTLNGTENGYGTYEDASVTNVWYTIEGEEQQLTPYGNAHVYSAESLIVSCINTPDAEGNVTLYQFTLYKGEEPEGPATALDNLNTTVAPVKMIENGQLIIINNGVQYNAQGAILK